MPSWAKNEPPLYPGDEFYLSAFYELSTCRPIGFSIGPIPWNVVVEYGEYHGLEPDVLRAFIQVIRAMDSEYLKWEERRKPKDG